MSSQSALIFSPNDSRQYRYLTFDNALRVLLVQDEQSQQAAASMAVNVGHFDDPQDRPGMAHFLEHMLFLGTEQYPEPAAYHALINRHGGNNNAWTGTEHTNFFYSLDADAFEASLARFSQFFIAPCFNLDLVDRERQAIEAEYSMKLKDDIRRVYQVHKETVNQAHPFSKFSVGNQITLGGDKTQLRDELLQFYHAHYSANLMTLCLVAPLPLDTLEQLALQYFDGIENKQLTKYYPSEPLYRTEELTREILIVPLKEQKHLSISFALPGIDSYYRTKPLTFISHLLGNESQGSLLHYFKEQGWATALSAGGGINGYNFKDYNIRIQLTDAGLARIDHLTEACFAFIQLVQEQGLQDWRYDERASLLEVAFRFQEPIKPMDLASHLSINMQHYDAMDIIYGDYRMDGLDIDECLTLLQYMTPSNMRLQLIAPGLDTDRQAKWYHTPYLCRPIAHERLARWQHPGTISDLALPQANPFIVSKPQARPGGSESPVPRVVAESKGYRIWHKKDDEFQVPKGHIYLSLDSEKASSTPREAALTRLYVEMLQDYLTEYTYNAEVAGLNYTIYPHQGGLTLHLSGLTGNQEKLLALIIEKARERNFSPSRFQATKRQLLQAWYNAGRAKPISQLFTSLTVTLQRRSYEPAKLAEMLEDVTLDDLHEHVRAFYQRIHLEGLVYGDWLESEVEQLAHRLNLILSLVSSPNEESERQLVDISGRGTLLRELNIPHPDSGIIVYYQSASTEAREMALFSLLNHTMSSSFFHELRTQKQLGYMVGTGYLPLHRHPGMIFYIQSPSAGPLTLLQAIDEFIADFNYAVMQITREQWEHTKRGLIQQVMEHDANQKTRSQRYWASIGNKDYSFNQREQVVAQISQISRSDLIGFNMTHLRTKHANRLVIYNCGDQPGAQQQLQHGTLITDLRQFKNQANKFSL